MNEHEIQREAEKMTADAILLERTCAMMERRFGDDSRMPATRVYLTSMAVGLRDTASEMIRLLVRPGP